MESIDVDKLQPDPLAAALAGTDKETVTVSGYICAVDEATLSVCTIRDGTSYISYPRSAVIAAFTDEKSDQVTLLIDAHARVKTVSLGQAGTLSIMARAVNDSGNCSGARAWADSEGQAMPSTAEQGAPGGPSTVPPGYGRRCKRVPYWVCVGNRCWIEYAWECTYYPLPRAQFA